MLNFESTNIEKVSVHSVGNKTNGEDIHLSKSELKISAPRLKELLLKFFLSPFKSPDYYSFAGSAHSTSPGEESEDELTGNPMYNLALNIFDDERSFHHNSISIATHLYELSEHPQIKPGDVFIVYFNGVIVDDEMVNAIGVFKSEVKHPFLKLDTSPGEFFLSYEDGINIEKLDKGCLILDTERSIGFRICIVDNVNKASEAQYWKESFLQLKIFNDDFYYTRQVMAVTKNYVTKEAPPEMDPLDRIDLLKRSEEYFKTKENFNRNEFENEVLQDEGLIKSFRGYNQKYMQDNDIDLSDEFEISPEALRRQQKIFKSVLKLDKNFHVYIHGDTNMIERGVDNSGRKYYKIFYENES